MSCHYIGSGIDFILKNVLDMYDANEITKDAAKKMIRIFPQAVHYCDGNEGEALEYLTQYYCANYLHKYSNESSFSLWNIDDYDGGDFFTLWDLNKKIIIFTVYLFVETASLRYFPTVFPQK